MTALRLFHSIEPFFCAGLLDDPLLLVRIRPSGRSLLFDCGQIHHLAKRTLRSIDAVFISHAHMDHFMGLDHLVRHTHVSPRPLDLYGPPGIAARVVHKLAGYDWNLAEEWWRIINVYEVHHNHIEQFRFAGARRFTQEPLGKSPRQGDRIYSTPFVTVNAILVDHGIPVLAFRLTEKDVFTINQARLRAAGFLPGPWLEELKARWKSEWRDSRSIDALLDTLGGMHHQPITDVAGLYEQVRDDKPAASLGYVTDIGYTTVNRQHLQKLLTDVGLLCCECTFLAADKDKARRSRHLCTLDVSELVTELRPRVLLPMHLSKAYIRKPFDIYDELVLAGNVRLLRLPAYLTPRPRLLTEFPPVVNFVAEN